jgi:putative membrane protein insertion efficiency factor
LNPLQAILVIAISVYRWTISPAQTFLFGPTAGCRFTPTCSQFAVDAIRSRGAIAGSWLAAKRICRCHPFGGCGHDPIPKSGKWPAAPKRGECGKAESGNILEHAT